MLLHESVREGHEENGETPKEGHHYDLQQKHRTSEEKRRVLGLLSVRGAEEEEEPCLHLQPC